MKQHITVEQLNELSDKGKYKLGDYLFNKKLLRRLYSVDDTFFYPDLSYFPLLTIGQMVEFLEENTDGALSIYISRQIRMNNEKINLEKYYVGFIEKGVPGKVYGKRNSLCGNLWEAVKVILET